MKEIWEDEEGVLYTNNELTKIFDGYVWENFSEYNHKKNIYWLVGKFFADNKFTFSDILNYEVSRPEIVNKIISNICTMELSFRTGFYERPEGISTLKLCFLQSNKD